MLLRRFFSVTVCLLGSLCLLAPCCGESDVEKNDAGVSRKLSIPPQDIVATVNDEIITTNDFEIFLETTTDSYDFPGGREEVLQALVEEKLLAQEARRRGFESDPDVNIARRKAAAYAFLTSSADTFTTADISMKRLKRYYDGNILKYVHKRMRKVLNYVALANRWQSREEARAIVEKVYAATQHVTTAEEFQNATSVFTKDRRKSKVEDLPAFEEGSQVLLKEFTDAAFAVNYPTQKVSRVVETKYGYHILFVQNEEPPLHIPFEQVEAELREQLYEQALRIHISEMVQDIFNSKKSFIYDELSDSEQRQ